MWFLYCIWILFLLSVPHSWFHGSMVPGCHGATVPLCGKLRDLCQIFFLTQHLYTCTCQIFFLTQGAMVLRFHWCQCSTCHGAIGSMVPLVPWWRQPAIHHQTIVWFDFDGSTGAMFRSVEWSNHTMVCGAVPRFHGSTVRILVHSPAIAFL